MDGWMRTNKANECARQDRTTTSKHTNMNVNDKERTDKDVLQRHTQTFKSAGRE